jgi:hypothetical protein
MVSIGNSSAPQPLPTNVQIGAYVDLICPFQTRINQICAPNGSPFLGSEIVDHDQPMWTPNSRCATLCGL